MAMKPMQRKANNSFLLGIVITLLITGAIIVFLIFQVMNLNETISEREATLTSIYVMSDDVKSGQVITNELFTTMQVFSDTVPANAIEDMTMLDTYFLSDELGNQAYTGYKLRDDNNIITNIPDANGDGYKILSSDDYEGLSETDRSRFSEVTTVQYINRNNENCEMLYDADLDRYYILVPDGDGNYTKELLETMPLIAKIDLNANTVITPEMFTEGQLTSDDLRTQEYNVIVPQTQLMTDDYIDVRLRLPDGQDLIVVSHKKITIPEMEDGTLSTTNLLMDLTEDEILTMSCAIVESYQMNGSMLYATKYVEPGIQDAATPTYIPNVQTIALVRNDPNIVQTAKQELISRYNDDVATPNGDTQIIRDTIDSAINSNEDAADSVIEKTEDEISSLQDERETYIESMGY